MSRVTAAAAAVASSQSADPSSAPFSGTAAVVATISDHLVPDPDRLDVRHGRRRLGHAAGRQRSRVLDKLREHAGRERVRRPDHRRADGGQDDGYRVTERLGRRAGDAFDPVARDRARDDG